MKKKSKLSESLQKYNTFFCIACDVDEHFNMDNAVVFSSGINNEKYATLMSSMFAMMEDMDELEHFIKTAAAHFDKAVIHSKTDGNIYGKSGDA